MKLHNSARTSPAKQIIHYSVGTAVMLLMLVELTAVYQYVTSSPKQLFKENYHPYILHVVRGASKGSFLKDAYQDGKMDSVIWGFNTLDAPQPDEYLLTGIAYLEKNQPKKAIEILKALIQNNLSTNSDYFEEDAEYYLAMSYLSNDEPEKAMPILEKIQANPDNPYFGTVSAWSIAKMKNSIAKK